MPNIYFVRSAFSIDRILEYDVFVSLSSPAHLSHIVMCVGFPLEL